MIHVYHYLHEPLTIIIIILYAGIRVVSNAGGINPHECANALLSVAKESSLDLKVAVVTGDDLMSDVEKLRQAGIKDMDSGLEFPSNVESVNAYLG